jgi:hypothetical protein
VRLKRQWLLPRAAARTDVVLLLPVWLAPDRKCTSRRPARDRLCARAATLGGAEPSRKLLAGQLREECVERIEDT